MPTLLLDLDGTLTDPREGIVGSIRHALARLDAPVPPDAELLRCIGPPLADSFAELLEVPRQSPKIDEAIGHYRDRFDAHGWRENRVYAGIPELLHAAREHGFRCVVATSKPTLFAERIVQHFALRDHLAHVYGAELDGTRGAKAELLEHVLASEAIAAEDAVMVGDRRHDVDGARANGIACIGVLWGYGSLAELESAGADRVCSEPSSLLAAVASLGRS